MADCKQFWQASVRSQLYIEFRLGSIPAPLGHMIRQFKLAIFLIALLIQTLPRSEANTPVGPQPTFGWEFELSNDVLMATNDPWGNKKLERKHLDQFLEMYREICPKCVFEHSPKHNTDNSFKITFPDGFHMTVATKPSVFEFTGPPMTTQELKANHRMLEERIFNPARRFKLKVNDFTAGHVSIGYSSGFQSPEMLMKFLVDSQNYHLLWSHILNNDDHNAPTLVQLGRKQRLALHRVIREFRTNRELQQDHTELARKITLKVYNRTKAWNEAAYHYQAINIETLDEIGPVEEQRIELRGVRGQTEARQFLLLAEIFERRLQFLRESTTPLAFAPHPELPKRGKQQVLVDTFYTYLTEMGLEFERYRELLPKRLQNLEPTLRTEFFHRNAPARLDCGYLFIL